MVCSGLTKSMLSNTGQHIHHRNLGFSAASRANTHESQKGRKQREMCRYTRWQGGGRNTLSTQIGVCFLSLCIKAESRQWVVDCLVNTCLSLVITQYIQPVLNLQNAKVYAFFIYFFWSQDRDINNFLLSELDPRSGVNPLGTRYTGTWHCADMEPHC